MWRCAAESALYDACPGRHEDPALPLHQRPLDVRPPRPRLAEKDELEAQHPRFRKCAAAAASQAGRGQQQRLNDRNSTGT